MIVIKHPSESEEQITVINWALWHEKQYPELALLHHIPNGGLRSKKTAAKLKREGVKPGIPDLCLPVARHGYHGLYIEMKSKVGRLSDDQKKMIESLRDQGHYAVDCKGADAAIKLIEWYIGANGYERD